jgi:putative ABC transport system permease protein
VVMQICITLLLITGTYAIHHQLAFIDQTKLSEHKDQVITVRVENVLADKIPVYKEVARHDLNVGEISMGPHLPRRENFGNLQRSFHFKELGEGNYSWDMADTDFDFPSMFQLEFLAGRDFSRNNPADTSAVILNEAAIKELGISPEKALSLEADEVSYFEEQGKMIAVTTKHRVIGVVKDFNYASVRNAIEPFVISGQSKTAEMMYIRLQKGTFSKTIEHLQRSWKKIYPATPFQYWFLDEEFGRLYRTERQMATLVLYLAGIAIFIACLGLFGLASFTAEQKTKEIGIRKVLGASSFQVLAMLTSRYVKLSLISFVIGTPISFIVIRSWLERFAYKAEIGNWLYVCAFLLITVIMITTVGMESLRAARANPADSIRHD